MSKDLLVLADEYAAATATFARALALKDEADSMSPIAREAGDKRAVLAEALSALDTAQPERAEDAVNAKRYLWLRDEAYSASGKTPFIVIGRDDSNCYVVSGTTADEAIDAAVKQGGQHD